LEKGNNDIKTYSAEDITRYWEGKMSPQEMHALEAAAMEDPFLADALDGYASIKPATAAADIDELRERLLDRSQDEKIIPIKRDRKWLRIAAIVIFLAGGSLAAYMVLQQGTTNELAKQDAAAATTENADMANKDIAPALPADTLNNTDLRSTFLNLHDSTGKDVTVLNQQQANRKGAGTYSYSTTTAPNAQKTDVAVNVPDLSQFKKKDTTKSSDAFGDMAAQDWVKHETDSVVIASSDAGRANPDRLQRRVSGGIQAPSSNQPASRNNNDRLTLNSFNGRVVDQQNNAIPYASVRLYNSNQVAATNNYGYFQLKSPDTVLNLSIASVGFESRNVTLRGNDPLQNVTLDPMRNSKLEEVKVTSSKNAEKEAIADKTAKAKKSSEKPSNLNVYVMDAQPVNGWDEYNKYLEENKRSDDKNVKGEVVVSFWINKKGKLSDFTVEKSLGKAQDEEATRLIKEGPGWKLLKGRKTRARVIVPF
jgi:hypothetical protein